MADSKYSHYGSNKVIESTGDALELGKFYDRLLIKRAQPVLAHSLFGQKKSVAMRKGMTINFQRFENLKDATTPLTVATPPTGNDLVSTVITSKINEYGDFVTVSDIADMTAVSDVMTAAVETIGYQMGKTLDSLTRNALLFDYTYDSTKNTIKRETKDVVVLGKIDFESTTLKLMQNNAPFISEMVTASSGEGTVPLRAAYWGVISVDLIPMLESTAGFVPVSKYAKQSDVQNGEWGSTGNIRWIVTTNSTQYEVKKDNASCNVYPVIVFGKDAYGVVDLDGAAAKTIIKPLGSAGTADPLNQKATVGWKAFHSVAILNEDYMDISFVSSGAKPKTV